MNGLVPTVFIVDDSREVRSALSRILSAAGYSVRAYESAERFIGERDASTPGCLLLDLCLPGLSGLELQSELQKLGCEWPIVFLTGMGDIQIGVNAMKSGAVDFLTKPIDYVLLFAAVDNALRRDALQRAAGAVKRAIRRRYDTLTPRERQVMAQVIRGRLNKQIAADLGTGEKTVKVHRARVMSKMEARSIAELVQLAGRVGIAIEPVLCKSSAAFNWLSPNPQGSLVGAELEA
jgi:FixJ family two-component response regulator